MLVARLAESNAIAACVYDADRIAVAVEYYNGKRIALLVSQ